MNLVARYPSHCVHGHRMGVCPDGPDCPSHSAPPMMVPDPEAIRALAKPIAMNVAMHNRRRIPYSGSPDSFAAVAVALWAAVPVEVRSEVYEAALGMVPTCGAEVDKS